MHTGSAVLYLHVIGGTNFLFIDEWIKGIYFASFYFRVCVLTRKIRENKNLAKISTYTVFCFLFSDRKNCPVFNLPIEFPDII